MPVAAGEVPAIIHPCKEAFRVDCIHISLLVSQRAVGTPSFQHPCPGVCWKAQNIDWGPMVVRIESTRTMDAVYCLYAHGHIVARDMVDGGRLPRTLCDTVDCC
jgi:hypothetical protein